MNLIVGTILLAWILAFCVYIVADVWRYSREMAHEELLDELWTEDDDLAESA